MTIAPSLIFAAKDDNVADRAQLLSERGHDGNKSFADKQHLRLSVIYCKDDLWRSQPRVYRHQHGVHLRCARYDLEKHVGVFVEDRDTTAGSDAGRDKC